MHNTVRLRIKREVATMTTDEWNHTEAHPMTTKEAALIQVKWRGQSALETCRHLTLELEFTNQGDSADRYVCLLCGEVAARRI